MIDAPGCMGSATRSAVAFCIVSVFAQAFAALAGAEERLVSEQGIDVVIVDASGWCGTSAALTFRGDDLQLFRGDRTELQEVLGGVRAILSFECA